jgi:hypothetical protein
LLTTKNVSEAESERPRSRALRASFANFLPRSTIPANAA